jgi:hypothetical protein
MPDGAQKVTPLISKAAPAQFNGEGALACLLPRRRPQQPLRHGVRGIAPVGAAARVGRGTRKPEAGADRRQGAAAAASGGRHLRRATCVHAVSLRRRRKPCTCVRVVLQRRARVCVHDTRCTHSRMPKRLHTVHTHGVWACCVPAACIMLSGGVWACFAWAGARMFPCCGPVRACTKGRHVRRPCCLPRAARPGRPAPKAARAARPSCAAPRRRARSRVPRAAWPPATPRGSPARRGAAGGARGGAARLLGQAGCVWAWRRGYPPAPPLYACL